MNATKQEVAKRASTDVQAAKAREENEELKKQIAELQAKLAGPQS